MEKTNSSPVAVLVCSSRTEQESSDTNIIQPE